MKRVETTITINREEITSSVGKAIRENGRLIKAYIHSAGQPPTSLTTLSPGQWTELLLFVEALYQRRVGRHYVITEWAKKYIWVDFGEDADLNALVSYYAAAFEERSGCQPNVLVMHPDESYDLPHPLGFLVMKRSEIIPLGTFRIGYEEPTDAEEETVSD